MAERGVNNSAADVAAATIQQEGLQIPDIRFDFDEYKIKPENQAILKAGARALAQQTSSTLVIEGHCDERGTVEYNLALGQRRADEAAKFLMDLGIAKERIKTISYGEEMPLSSTRFDVDGETTRFDEVSGARPMTLGMNRTVTITVDGHELAPGKHKLGIGFIVAGMGRMEFDVTDAVGGDGDAG